MAQETKEAEGVGGDESVWDEAVNETEIDPVCGMEVERSTAVGASHYDGTRYYFCSEACKLSFDGNPEEYVGAYQDLSP
jgi:YHS domain-containing protein